jgi:hypothetical protein
MYGVLVRTHIAWPMGGRVYAIRIRSVVDDVRVTAFVVRCEPHGIPSRNTATTAFCVRLVRLSAARSSAARRPDQVRSCARVTAM